MKTLMTFPKGLKKISLRQEFGEKEKEEARQAQENILNSRVKKCPICGALIPTWGGCPICAYKLN